MLSKNSNRQTPPAKHLQRSFEHAVRDIYQVGLTGKISDYRTPIVQRAGRAVLASPVNAEKQAVSDAAKALAQLWKISPNLSR
jgi:hypothetical protein